MRDLACRPSFFNCFVWTGTASKAEANLTLPRCSSNSGVFKEVENLGAVPSSKTGRGETYICWLWGVYHPCERFYPCGKIKVWLKRSSEFPILEVLLAREEASLFLFLLLVTMGCAREIHEFSPKQMLPPSQQQSTWFSRFVPYQSIPLVIFHASIFKIFLFFSCLDLDLSGLLWLLGARKSFPSSPPGDLGSSPAFTIAFLLFSGQSRLSSFIFWLVTSHSSLPKTHQDSHP